MSDLSHIYYRTASRPHPHLGLAASTLSTLPLLHQNQVRVLHPRIAFCAAEPPLSTVGSITLNSSSPWASPLIDPGLFTAPFDVQAMLYAIKSARAFMQSAPWAGIVLGRTGTVGEAESDDEIIAAARASASSIFHPTSTARMSPANADFGVVDPQLRVKGVTGLRVVDASVFVRDLLRLPSINLLTVCLLASPRYLRHTLKLQFISLQNALLT